MKQQQQPGVEKRMRPRPKSVDFNYTGSGKLNDKVAIVTGGDSGIGRAVAYAFAKEGADLAIVYLRERKDAQETKQWIERQGRRCLTIAGNVGDEKFCQRAVEQTVREYGHVDILVNNAAEQHQQASIDKISRKQLEDTFRTNIFAYFFMVKAVLPHLKSGSTILNTASVTAYRGSDHLIDYSSTKGAIVAFTRSLSKSLVERGIRVNGVAPGPIWTPLIAATFSPKQMKDFGKQVPMKRPGQPEEVAPSYVFLASDDSSYMAGQFLHPNGGEIVNT